MDDSRELVERASRGDPGAVEKLLVQHLPRLRAYVRLRMGPELRAKESASDLVQSACRDVLEHSERFVYDGESNFRHWLFATALRKVQNRVAYYRAARRDLAREARADADEALAAYYQTLSTPSRKLMLQERIEELEAAMAQLPDNHREVILLARVVGLPHREVAAAMGKSETATRSLLRRALAQLAELLDRQS